MRPAEAQSSSAESVGTSAPAASVVHAMVPPVAMRLTGVEILMGYEITGVMQGTSGR